MSTAMRSEASPLMGHEAPSARDDIFFEVVNGQVLELPPMGAKEIRLANILAAFIAQQMPQPMVGEVLIEMLFQLAKRPRVRDRRPDLAFVPYDRWPTRQIPEEAAWPMTPALAVEIVSKSNSAWEVRRKVDEYLAAGVGLVWVIYPGQHLVEVHAGPKESRTLRAEDTLIGGAVMPWFSLPLKQLFAYYPLAEETDEQDEQLR